MGIIKAIKQNELIGNDGKDFVYPITSTKAVYNEQNKSLHDILETNNNSIIQIFEHQKNLISDFQLAQKKILEQEASQNVIIIKNEELESKLSKTANTVGSIDTKLIEIDDNLNNITRDIETINNNLNQISNNLDNKENYIVGHIEIDKTRGLDTIDLKFCTIGKDGYCSAGENLTEVLQKLKDGSFIVPKNSGTYTLENSVLDIQEVSIIQKQKDLYVAISLGIPFLPEITDNDNGKSLKIAENKTLYWG